MGFVPISIPHVIINTLYTVIGIFFGIGFSLIISSTYKDVKRRDSRQALRNNIMNIRDRFIFYFIVATITYVISVSLNKNYILERLSQILPCKDVFDMANNYHISFSALCVMIIIILTFIRSYNNLQNLNNDIDDLM